MAGDDVNRAQATTERLWNNTYEQKTRYRFISPAEWGIFDHGVGGVKDAEHHTPVHSSDGFWPPSGMPQGLYRDVVFSRTKSRYFFHCTSIARWALLIFQLLLGATLTALGSFATNDGIPITVLGATNTIVAGLLALVHNSGLPDRYRYDMAEFEALEDHIRKVLDSGIVPADKGIDQVLGECFDVFHAAKTTVAANKPTTYIPGHILQPQKQGIMAGSYDIAVAPQVPEKSEKRVSTERAGK